MVIWLTMLSRLNGYHSPCQRSSSSFGWLSTGAFEQRIAKADMAYMILLSVRSADRRMRQWTTCWLLASVQGSFGAAYYAPSAGYGSRHRWGQRFHRGGLVDGCSAAGAQGLYLRKGSDSAVLLVAWWLCRECNSCIFDNLAITADQARRRVLDEGVHGNLGISDSGSRAFVMVSTWLSQSLSRCSPLCLTCWCECYLDLSW